MYSLTHSQHQERRVLPPNIKYALVAAAEAMGQASVGSHYKPENMVGKKEMD